MSTKKKYMNKINKYKENVINKLRKRSIMQQINTNSLFCCNKYTFDKYNLTKIMYPYRHKYPSFSKHKKIFTNKLIIESLNNSIKKIPNKCIICNKIIYYYIKHELVYHTELSDKYLFYTIITYIDLNICKCRKIINIFNNFIFPVASFLLFAASVYTFFYYILYIYLKH